MQPLGVGPAAVAVEDDPDVLGHPGAIHVGSKPGVSHRAPPGSAVALEVVLDEAPGHPHRLTAERVVDVGSSPRSDPANWAR